MKYRISHILSVVILFTTCNHIYSQKYNVSVAINAFEGKPAVLYSVKGSKYLPLDTVKIKNGKAGYLFAKPLPKGAYTILFNDSITVDFISDITDIEMQTKLPDAVADMQVIKSAENKVYYDYLKFYNIAYDSAMQCRSDADMLKAMNAGNETYQSKELRERSTLIFSTIRSYAKKLIAENPGLFVSKILKGGIMPEYSDYINTPGATKYDNPKDFYREHFFDNIDLADSNLLRTKIIYTAVNDYITNFADPPSNEAYITTIDFVLKKTQGNTAVYEYLLELLTTTFGSSPWEKVYIHLVDNYINKDACGTEISGQSNYTSRAEAMKKLEPGNPAANLQLADTNGKVHSLYDIQAKYTLLFFWSTTCEHCKKAIPELLEVYKKFADKGFSIYAFAIAEDMFSWKYSLNLSHVPWVNVSDLKGHNSEIMTQFNLWSTPSFFILDKDKKIIERPFNVISVNKFLTENLH